MQHNAGKSRFNYRGHALRAGRVSIPGHVYLVTTVTIRRERLFAAHERARICARLLCQAQAQGACNSLAWVVMPDHVHWLLRLESGVGLAAVVKGLKGRVARELNRVAGREGRTVWQPGFHDHALRSHENLRATARYIVGNPLRAGLVDAIGDYPFWDIAWL